MVLSAVPFFVVAFSFYVTTVVNAIVKKLSWKVVLTGYAFFGLASLLPLVYDIGQGRGISTGQAVGKVAGYEEGRLSAQAEQSTAKQSDREAVLKEFREKTADREVLSLQAIQLDSAYYFRFTSEGKQRILLRLNGEWFEF